MITLERWKTLRIRDQLGHIASEVNRAILVKEKDADIYRQILERALNLIDLSLSDRKWRRNPLLLLSLRDEVAKAYVGEGDNLEKLAAAF